MLNFISLIYLFLYLIAVYFRYFQKTNLDFGIVYLVLTTLYCAYLVYTNRSNLKELFNKQNRVSSLFGIMQILLLITHYLK
jgi:hypothetical protein